MRSKLPKPAPAPEQKPEAAAAGTENHADRRARVLREGSAGNGISLAARAEAPGRRDRRAWQRGNAEAAVAALSTAASQGNNDANIALVHVQHWCDAIGRQRPAIQRSQIAKLVQNQPEQRAARVAGVIYAEVELHAARKCGLQKGAVRLQGYRSTIARGRRLPAMRRARQSLRSSCATPPSAKRCCSPRSKQNYPAGRCTRSPRIC